MWQSGVVNCAYELHPIMTICFIYIFVHIDIFTFLCVITIINRYLIVFSTVSAIRGSDYIDEFILLPINGDHTECVFDKTQIGEHNNETKATINLCDCPPSNFMERPRVMQELYRHFVDNHRCITLKGSQGMFLFYIHLYVSKNVSTKVFIDDC
jgi:hypothetical protein